LYAREGPADEGEVMIRKTLIAVVVAGALGVPTGAAAETSKLEVAKRGTLKVLSSVIVKHKAVEMMADGSTTTSHAARNEDCTSGSRSPERASAPTAGGTLSSRGLRAR
jgi:hypothetical protein